MCVLVEKVFHFTQQFPLQRVFGLELMLKTYKLTVELANLIDRQMGINDNLGTKQCQ